MEQRALALGGTFRAESAPGRGVTVQVELPVSAAVVRMADGRAADRETLPST
jgi:chemotaxis protein histidine kinase CheA